MKRNVFFLAKKCNIQKVDLLEVEPSLIIWAFFCASLLKNHNSYSSSNFQNLKSKISNLAQFKKIQVCEFGRQKDNRNADSTYVDIPTSTAYNETIVFG